MPRRANTQTQQEAVQENAAVQANAGADKEFGKMLREVANIYSQLGDTPLAEEGDEREEISRAIRKCLR